MIRASLLLAALLILPATASAAGSGGTLAGPAASAFSASPATVAPGAKVTFAFRATPGALVRVDVIAPGKPAARIRLGRVGAAGRSGAPGRRPWRQASTRRGWSSAAPGSRATCAPR